MNKPFKLLIVADTLDVEKSSGAKGRIALIKGFLELGYQLKVLHYSRKEVEIQGVSCFSIPEKKNTGSYFKAKLQLLYQRLSKHNINHRIEARKGFSYTHDYDVASIQHTIKQEAPENYDYIVALSYASSFRAHKAILQLPEWHHKFLPYIHDPYPMHSYPRPYDWVEPGHQKKRDFFIALFTAARSIIYPSKLLGDWMESYYHSGKGKAVIIPHLISQDLKDTGIFPAYFDPSLFNLLHAGSLMSARNPIALIKAFSRFIKANPEAQKDARMVMVSEDSVFHKEMKQLAQDTPQIILSPSKEPFQKTFNMQQKAAVNVVLEAKGPASPFLPGKVPHCVAANKPILLLGPYYSETKRILGKDYPYWSEIDDIDQICEMIEELYQKWRHQDQKLYLNRPDVESYLSAASVVKAFEIIHES
ncbi:MAG: UDP-glycosyltransferase [Nonlabens sp.]|uniref:UDP-glycosyltransferase n=1 Tax=Nonlabens sp. TaxID=1888209 RepID=UPI003EF8DF59